MLSTFLLNEGSAVSILNAEVAFADNLTANNNCGDKGGFLHIAEFGEASMKEVSAFGLSGSIKMHRFF